MKANEDMQQKKKNRKSVTPCKVREQEGRGGKVSGCGCQKGNGLRVFISPHIKIRPKLFGLGFCKSVELCSSLLVSGFKLSAVYFVFVWGWGEYFSKDGEGEEEQERGRRGRGAGCNGAQ